MFNDVNNLGVTAHFINRNWELEVFSIALRRILNHHTAENIALWYFFFFFFL